MPTYTQNLGLYQPVLTDEFGADFLPGLTGSFQTLDDKVVEALNGSSFPFTNVTEYGAKGGGSDDTKAIKDAINAAPRYGTLVLPGDTYGVSSTIAITKPLQIIGRGATLKTLTNGMNNTLYLDGVNDFFIKGIKFDQNLKGRTSIEMLNCHNFDVSGCYFTGYTAEYGYYQTDGGILANKCQDGHIHENIWENHGYQYDAPNFLNRCISLGGTGDQSDRITISNNVFDTVMQAVIIDGGYNNAVTGNTFYNVKDNAVYSLGNVGGLSISGNTFNEIIDEAVVLGGSENVAISGNDFRNVNNKCIALDYNVENIAISGNNFRTLQANNNGMQVLKTRVNIESVKTLTFVGNTIGGVGQYNIVSLTKSENVIISNNSINVIMSETGTESIINMNGVNNHSFIITSNFIKSRENNGATYAVWIEGGGSNSLIANNISNNCGWPAVPSGTVERDNIKG